MEGRKKGVVVTAHPDDESLMSVALWKLTHELNFIIDIVVLTDGEGGHAHSHFSKIYYNDVNLNIGEKRQEEMKESANILGIRNVTFLHQADAGYTLDVSVIFPQKEQETFTSIWDTSFVLKTLIDIFKKEEYDVMILMLPSETIHAHHKGSCVLALQAYEQLDKKPAVIANREFEYTPPGSNSDHSLQISQLKSSILDRVKQELNGNQEGKEEAISSSSLDNYQYFYLSNFPITKVKLSQKPFLVSRNQLKGRVPYQIIANWVIAAHKTQGLLQMDVNLQNFEEFWVFDCNDDRQISFLNYLFQLLDTDHNSN